MYTPPEVATYLNTQICIYTHAQAVGPLAVLLFLPQFHYGFVVLNASVLGLQVAVYVCIMYNSRIVYCS